MKVYFLDKLGWPVERIKGRPILNFFRLLIHTRRITTTRPKYLSSEVMKDCDCPGPPPVPGTGQGSTKKEWA